MKEDKVIISKVCITSIGHGFWAEINFKRTIYKYKTRKEAANERQKFIDAHPYAKIL